MKFIPYIFVLYVLALVLVGGCKDFEELGKDPNRPTTAPPQLILPGILKDMTFEAWDDVQKYNQYYCINYNYYGNNEYNWTTADFSYYTLNNVIKMEEEAVKLLGQDNPYAALGKYFRAYFFSLMTLRQGDIPVTEALQGRTNVAPKYDSQKEVFVEVLRLLDAANTQFATLIAKNDRSLQGDFYLNGDLRTWQKVVNAFTLRTLIHLSKHADVADLKVKEKFAAILNDPVKYPLFTSNSDNLAYPYNGTENFYPLNPGNRGFHSGRYNMSATFLNTLVSLKDPRTFVVADPAVKKIAGGLTASDFEAYVGASSGESLDDMTFKMGNGEYSAINQSRYYSTFAGPEKTIQVGYPEMCFNIAEAANRGWVNANAQEWYNKGISAAMEILDITNSAAVNDYLNTTAVKYQGNTNKGLEQILLQKYLAFFQNSGWEAYFNWRRTGFPEFLTGVGTGNSGRIPLRFLYPASERNTNPAQYQVAIDRQFGGKDDINMTMWIIQ